MCKAHHLGGLGAPSPQKKFGFLDLLDSIWRTLGETLDMHKDCTDLLNVANEFVGDSEHRLRLFGKFK